MEFEGSARYYDILYGDKDYEAECTFLEGIWDRFMDERPIQVLDLGCGTGGHSIPLAKKGYNVTGLDISGPMVHIAREKARRAGVDIQFIKSGICEMDIVDSFDAVICMFSAIGYLKTLDDLERALRSVYHHTKSLFVFDFWNALAVVSSYSPSKMKEVNKGHKRLVRESESRIRGQQLVVDYSFKEFKKDEEISTLKERHAVRFFRTDEMEGLLKSAGFEPIMFCPFMDYDGEVTEGTWNVTAVARKMG